MNLSMVVIAVVILVSVVVPVMVLVPVVVFIPAVIMFETAVISIPVTRIILLPIVARFDPSSAFVGRTCPVAVMPLVVVARGKPITVHPCEFRAWALGRDADHSWARWRTNSDAKSNLSLRCRPACQQDHSKQQGFPNEISGDFEFSYTTPTNNIVQDCLRVSCKPAQSWVLGEFMSVH